MSILKAKVILNIKTSSEWSSSTDVLLEGEIGIESDTRLIKVGDGSHIWNALPYGSIPDIRMLNGVTVTNPNNGEVFTYSNGLWVNSPLPSLPADTDLNHYDNTTSGFITASDIPALPADTDLSHYDNSTSDFATVSQIPTDVSQLNNDAGYITSASIPTVNDATITIQQNGSNIASFTTNQATNETVNITIPTNISAFNNDVGYLTNASLPAVNDGILTIKQNNTAVGTFSANSAANSAINITVPTKTSDLVNNSNFITSSDIPVVNNGTLTIKQDGNTVATFNANSANNVVANLTSGGGGGGGGASYTSQLTVDSSLVPDTDNVYSLGSAASRWTYLYATYLSSGDGTAITLEQSLVPDTDSSYDLGSSSYNFNAIYTDSIVLNGTTYTSIPTDTSDLTNNAGFITSAALPTVNDATLTIQKNSSNVGTFTANASSNVTIDISVPTDTNDLTNGAGFIANPVTAHILPNADNTYNLGESSAYWKQIFTHKIDLSSNVVVYSPDSPNYNQLMFKWYDEANSSSRYVSFKDNAFYPTSGGADLGTTTFVWNTVYTTNLVLNGTSYNSIPTDTSDLTNGAGYITGISNINNIGDVNITSATTNDYLKYDGSKWVNVKFTGDISTTSYNLLGTNSNSAISKTNLYVDNSNKLYSYDIIPRGSNSLGDANNHWINLYCNSSYIWNISDVATLDFASGAIGIRFGANNTCSIGSAANGLKNLHFGHNNTQHADSGDYGIFCDSGYVSICGKGGSNGGAIFYGLNALEICDITGQGVIPKGTVSSSVSNLNCGTTNYRWSNVHAKEVHYSTLTQYSDRKYKDNISELKSGLDSINTLQVCSFNWKDDDSHINYGIIAQDALKTNPDIVRVPEENNTKGGEEGDQTESEPLEIYVSNVIYLTVKAVQELSSKIDELNAKIKVLEETK